MKKLLSLLCAVLMLATMVVPAFAVEVIGQVLSMTSSNNGQVANGGGVKHEACQDQ